MTHIAYVKNVIESNATNTTYKIVCGIVQGYTWGKNIISKPIMRKL